MRAAATDGAPGPVTAIAAPARAGIFLGGRRLCLVVVCHQSSYEAPIVNDAELVAGLKANNDSAYREVVARHGDRLYRYVYSIVGDYHLTEDVVAETYLRMVERIDSYTFRGAPFQAWLYRIAHNLAINIVTRARPAVDIDAVAVAAPAAEPEAAAIARDESAAVRAALTALTEDQQQVLMLRFVAEQSVRDVAQSLEKTETAVKQLQLRALRSLGRLLGQEAG